MTAEPPPSATPYAPGRVILNSGYDTTDPYMLKVGDRYLLYTSEGFTFLNVPLWIGTKPGHWGQPVDVLPNLPGVGRGRAHVGARRAEGGGRMGAVLHRAAARGEPADPLHRFGLRPVGHRTVRGHRPPVHLPADHRGSIDARVFVESDGQLVMLWKSEDNANPNVPGPDQGGYTGIYAQDLSANGRTLLGTAVKILAPTQPWESTIVEAPDMIEAWGTYWLFFSGNWYDSAAYGIGVAQCQGPFGPCTDPNPAPFLGSNLAGRRAGRRVALRGRQQRLSPLQPLQGQ